MPVKTLIVVIGIFLFAGSAYAQVKPSWQLADPRQMSSFDMLTTRTGLFGISDDGYHAIAKFDNGKVTDIFTASDTITSLIIRDQNTAFFSVKSDGIYEASNGWKNFTLIYSDLNANIFTVFDNLILANIDDKLYRSTDAGVNFNPVGGIQDTVTAAEFFSPSTAVAVSGKKLYRSLNGGVNWVPVLTNLKGMNSIYIDRSHKLVYIGGGQLMKSSDSGATWQKISSIVFDTLTGAVIGARDCSGTIYLGPDALTHGTEILRSVDQARFFQDAGPAIFSSFRMRKAVVLDRGSTFFYLDSSGLLSFIRDGIDSTIPDSVSSRIQIVQDSGISNSLCPGIPPTSFGVSVSFDQCTGIYLDSLKETIPDGQFLATLKPDFLSDSFTMRIPFIFHATHSGWDTAHYRLRFHSPITGNTEEKYFDVIGFGKAGSPEIVLSETELHYPQTKADMVSSLSFDISNPGCDTLVIDTIFSTNPLVFKSQVKSYPLRIAPGKIVTMSVSFTPHLSGEYLESLEIDANTGTRFITLRGSTNPEVRVNNDQHSGAISIFPNPGDNVVSISSQNPLPKNIILRDLLGREISILHSEDSDTVHCDLHEFPNGWYIFDFGGNIFERILIRH